MSERRPTILLAEDDDDDSWFFEVAFDKNAGEVSGEASLVRVRNGAMAVDYLSGAGDYTDRQKHPFPQLIILDLNMPQKTGLEVLEWFQKQPEPSLVPVIVLSACEDPAMIRRALSLGANSYLIKPRDYGRYLKLARALKEYWLEWNQTPAREPASASRTFAGQPVGPEPVAVSRLRA